MVPVESHESIARSTLDAAEQRAVTFLKAAGVSPRIRAALAAAGFSRKAREEGYLLYFKVVVYTPSEAPTDTAAERAFEALEAWQSAGFARARAALHHKHAEVEAFVFAGLAAVRGPSALGAMATFLRRCEELESAPERKATRKEDRAALVTLEERGITKAVRDDLQSKLALATLDASADGGGGGAAGAPEALERRQHQVALYRWLQDWSETARAVITNRSDLIRLGVARPRRPKAAARPAPVAPPTPATPSAVTVAPALPLHASEEEPGPASRAA
jgi:hypothetical protein